MSLRLSSPRTLNLSNLISMDAVVKEEKFEAREVVPKETRPSETSKPVAVIDLSSSDYDSDDSDDSDDDSAMNPYAKRSNASNGVKGSSSKKQKLENLGIVLPLGFLDPLPPEEPLPLPAPVQNSRSPAVDPSYKQFWKAGDYEGGLSVDSSSLSSVGMDHVRVHPKFLHSNATSHKWALGAFAELLDNSLDEACHGATFVNIDMLENKKDGSRMLLVEDNGGGMDPDKIRQCMSLGYSEKSKLANTIGQYGNGFKTSTMRLGADVIVFSRCYGKDGQRPTQSIGLLSYTFLRSTAKQDIVVPMLDYEKGGKVWNRLMRLSPGDWDRNVETILQWSPYSSEADLLQQFNLMDDQGTRVIIYNLWEDDQGELELDFGTDRHDIQIRGVNRDEKKIEMAKHFPNSRHFLTYRHSLRSYASILYLRLPRGFRIVLRGKDVEHHNIVNDMMLIQEVTYRPQPGADGVPKDPNMVAVVTLGFVKDAKDHIDVQGFNVYHKNRLIKPFWRVWNPAGSDGRGVIGVLEANFVEPAHDKQGFERTTVLSRLEARLVQMQKTFWSTYCHKIGYAPRYQRKHVNESAGQESSPEYRPRHWSRHSKNFTTLSDSKGSRKYPIESTKTRVPKHGSKTCSSEPLSPSVDDDSDSEMRTIPPKGQPTGTNCKASQAQNSLQRERAHITRSFSQNSENSEIELDRASTGRNDQIVTCLQPMASVVTQNGDGFAANVDAPGLNQLQVENCELKDRLKKMEESFLHDLGLERERRKSAEAQLNGHSLSNSDARSVLQLKMENRELKDRLKKREEVFLRDLQIEKDRCKSLEAQLKESQQKIEEINKEQEILIDIFSEEKERRCTEEENLRKKLKVASDTIQELLDKLKLLGNIKSPKGNPESLQEK